MNVQGLCSAIDNISPDDTLGMRNVKIMLLVTEWRFGLIDALDFGWNADAVFTVIFNAAVEQAKRNPTLVPNSVAFYEEVETLFHVFLKMFNDANELMG